MNPYGLILLWATIHEECTAITRSAGPYLQKDKGKSGGARVITFLKIVNEKIDLVSIYDKGQIENLAKDQILEMLKKVGFL